LAGFKGRAIYLDSDMQVFKDIKDLWTLPFNDAQVLTVHEPSTSGRRPQFSVMLLDCEHLDWKIQDIVHKLDSGELTYERLMYDMAVAKTVKADVDASWNCLERYKETETALLHYTDMVTQPWISINNHLGYLWFRDLFEAVDSGFISREFVKEHVDRGYVRPSLWFQMEHRIEDSYLLPGVAKQLDKEYKAPFTTIHAHGASAWLNTSAFIKAVSRQVSRRTGLTALRKRMHAHFDRD
jgi:lipopolysaccharide biosynthesis glycosyltransferase